MKQSYDVTIECGIMGTSTKSTNTLDLKNPYFRYTGVQPAPPPGENSTSPSENYWGQVDMQGRNQAVNMVNGMIVDGLGHVSLDSGANTTQNVPPNPSQANIHQGSIPATGRKDARTSGIGSAGATAAAAAAAAMLHQQSTGATAATSAVQPVVSAPTSIPFNQLIGGAVSPNVLAAAAAAGAPQPAATNLVIGDYVQSNLGYVLNSNASAAANVLRQ